MDLLVRGVDSPALRELAGLHRPTRRDAAPVIGRVFRELRVDPLDPAVAWRIVAAHIAAEAVAGRMQPYEAAAELGDLCRAFDWLPDLVQFVAMLDEWDDHPGERPAIEADILQACRAITEAADPAP